MAERNSKLLLIRFQLQGTLPARLHSLLIAGLKLYSFLVFIIFFFFCATKIPNRPANFTYYLQYLY
jgi:hypothetical protein